MVRRLVAVMGAVLLVPVVAAVPAPAQAREILGVQWQPWPAVGRTATVTAQGLTPDHAYDVVVGDHMTVDPARVVTDADGSASAQVGVDADFPAQADVEVEFRDAVTGALVAGNGRAPDFPNLRVSVRNPLNPVVRVAAFAEGEGVRLRYGRNLTGPATTGDVGDYGTALTTTAVPTGQPFTTTVTATGTRYGRKATVDVPMLGDTLRVGELIDAIETVDGLARPTLVAAGGRWAFGFGGDQAPGVQEWTAGVPDPRIDTTACRYLSCAPPPESVNVRLHEDWLEIRPDGNLVRYQYRSLPSSPTPTAVWSTGTAGTGSDNRLRIGTDGVLRLTTASGLTVWTSAVGRVFRSALAPGQSLGPGDGLRGSRPGVLWMQTDGNLVYRTGSGSAAWSTRTAGRGATMVMQGDGNLVVRTSTAALWNTRTGGHPGATFGIQTDGNLVVRDTDGRALWALWGLAGSPLRTRPVGI